jgi:hypothetical protein
MSNAEMSKCLAVNRRVVGSSPTSGATNTIEISKLQEATDRWLPAFWSGGCCNSAGCFFLMLVDAIEDCT